MSVLEEVEELKTKKKGSKIKETVELEEEIQLDEKIDAKLEVMETKVKQDLGAVMENTVNKDASIKELARDLTYLKGASNLQSNVDFTTVYEQELGKQLVSDLKDEGKRQAIVNAARKQEARNLRSQAFYNSVAPIFKTLGIDKPFGLIAMIITSILLMIPYLVVSLVMFVINSINNIFTAIAKFSKPAMWICGVLVIMAITVAVILSVLYGIDAVFKTDIFGKHIGSYV